ncbi:MAG: preprotein translocase subunit SecG [Hydrogenophilaceae bacterium]|nr:preprotein translocase subunit SecG [Hydrogenophilaceae bacterium]
METLVWIIHLLVSVAVIGLVLLQHGKGADMGAAFGSGASGSLFGASGSANFLSRATAILATAFFLTSLTLTYFSLSRVKPEGVLEKIPASSGQSVPTNQAAPATVPAPISTGSGESKSGEIPK